MKLQNFFLFSFFSIICFACQQKQAPSRSTSNPYIGQWAWEKSDDNNSFSVEIIQKGDSLLGTYCGVVRSGAKMDCAVDNGDIAFWFKATNEKNVTFDFQSYRENDIGKASLTLENEKLIWKTLHEPKTEHYAWKEAIMQRVK